VVVASGGGGVSDGVGLGAGSAGIGAGDVVSAGGVFMSALSSFLAQPAANTIAVTASKAKARMSLPSSVSDELGVPY
jgi:O-acetyl-ADP-ribose deacetylase (regulator of RNase III)